MEIRIKNQKAELTNADRLVSNSVQVYSVAFSFDSAWDSLTKVAVFKVGTKDRIFGTPTLAVQVPATNVVKVPWEVLSTYDLELYVGVYGTDSNAVVLPTTWTNAGTILQGVDIEGDNTEPPTENIYQKWVNEISGYASKAYSASVTATSEAETATQKASEATQARDSVSGMVSEAQTASNSAKDSATAAATSASNASTSEENASASASSSASSATAAATSETNSASSASLSASSAAAAKISETNSKASETAAATSASNAATSATSSESSASQSASSATSSANSASGAATSASNAATSATNAASSASAAAISADAAAQAAGGGLTRQVVDILPTTDIKTNVIYCIPKTDPETGNYYDEYWYVNSKWELFGNSKTNLSGYYTSAQTDNLLSSKADSSVLEAHKGDTSNPHQVTKSQVGLGNVDNTADADKPISTAQKAALDLKSDETEVTAVMQSLSSKAPRPTQTAVTLSAASWVGTAPPYTYTISSVTCTATQSIVVYPAMNQTSAVIKDMAGAMITAQSQAANSIVLQAQKKPTVDIPIIIEVGGEPA